MANKQKNKRVSDKVKLLVDEGKDQKAAVGEALSMEDKGRLGSHGTYYRTPRKRTRRRQ